MKYLVLPVIAFVLLLADIILIIKRKKVLVRKTEHENIFQYISKRISFKKGKSYTKKKDILLELSSKLTVEIYYVYKIIFVIASSISFIVICVLNNINKLQIENTISRFNTASILVVILLSMFAPDAAVKLIVGIKKHLCRQEILILQTYTIILIKSGQNVKEILKSIARRSKYFRNKLILAINNFSSDSSNALEQLKNSSGNQDFKKIVIALEQCLNSDSNTALVFLYNSRKISNEMSRLDKLKSDGKKKIINTLMLILPLSAWAIVCGYPWLVYVLNLISNIPV